MEHGMIVVNLVAGVGTVIFGSLVVAVNRTHAFSICRELETRGGFDAGKIRVVAGDPVNTVGSYDLDMRLRNIGNLETHIPLMAWSAAVLLGMNALAFWVLRRSRGRVADSTAPDTAQRETVS